MLPPQQQSSKRSNYHRNNHVSYHPYYSSSPMGAHTSNLHCVSSSTSSVSSTSSLPVDTYLKDITLTRSNIQELNKNQFNSSKSKLHVDQSNYHNTIQDDENDLSSISTKTNPPTTPVSLNSANNTPVIGNESSNDESYISSPVCNLYKRTYNIIAEPILNVTPVTSNSSASSVSNIKFNQDKYSASCSSSCSSAVSTCSNVNATYSRSSSMTSLSSFDIKSTHSSVPSEYSCTNNNNQEHNTGLMTPASYSDLPDSPGELFPSTINFNRLINSSSLNNSANHQRYYNNKLINTTGLNEISVLTVDSNPSKSNDITIVERTVLGCTISNSNNTTHLVNNFGNSGCTTFIQNEEENNVIQNEDDERVVAYDVEGSLCDAASTRSNVSSLTFPNEPTADLAFIRNLLTKKSSFAAATFITDEMNNQVNIKEEKKEEIPTIQPTRLWSNYSYNKTISFTPPIKLNPVEINKENSLLKTSKKLIYDDEEQSYADNEENIVEDDDCARSIASLPSDIVRDSSASFNKSNFNALFNKLSNNFDNLKSQSKFYESSPLINNSNKKNDFILNQFNSDCNQNQSLENSFDTSNNQSYNTVCFLNNETSNSIIKNSNIIHKSKILKKAEDDNDDKILQDFIDEMLPIALANKQANEDNDDSEQDSMNESEESLQQLYQRIYQNNDLDSHVPLSTNLPKIDEEENEDDDEITVPINKGKVSNKITNSSKSVVVQMTKTTLLRVNKVMQTKSNSMSNNSTTSQNLNKRTSHQIKENFSSEKRPSLNTIQSKCSNTSTKSSFTPSAKRIVLMTSSKQNTNKTITKRFNTNISDKKT